MSSSHLLCSFYFSRRLFVLCHDLTCFNFIGMATDCGSFRFFLRILHLNGIDPHLKAYIVFCKTSCSQYERRNSKVGFTDLFNLLVGHQTNKL